LVLLGLESTSGARAFPSQPPAAGDEAGYAGADQSSSDAADEVAGRFGDSEGTYGPEQRAQELYLDGIEKLSGGHRDIAQQMFESVIARFPDSAAAGLARRRLGELYRAIGTNDGSPEAAPMARAAAAPAVAPAPEGPPGRSPPWQQELRRNAAIQAKLRGEAGDRVFFSAGSTELGTRARMALATQAQWLIRWREFEAAVEGHADEPGTAEENVTLSQQRAEAVRQRLIEEGVEASRISVVAAGSTQRVATCSAPDCSSQNRRAVTLVFANGTRARLGLAGPATADASTDRAPGPPTAKAVEPPVVPQQVGVTR
jgi:peptidoglycan-associated lipoprotein